jgi:hypothetical protein
MQQFANPSKKKDYRTNVERHFLNQINTRIRKFKILLTWEDLYDADYSWCINSSNEIDWQHIFFNQ